MSSFFFFQLNHDIFNIKVKGNFRLPTTQIRENLLRTAVGEMDLYSPHYRNDVKHISRLEVIRGEKNKKK
jgi:hypothetical protein